MSEYRPVRVCTWLGPTGPCPNPAEWTTTVNAGTWNLGVWFCDVHRQVWEAMIPLVGDPARRAATYLWRSPVIWPLDESKQPLLAPGSAIAEEVARVQGTLRSPAPHPGFTCDSCNQPIIYREDRWEHLDPVEPEHQATPG